MTRSEQPTQLDLELQIHLGARGEDAAQRPSPDDTDEPDAGQGEVEEDETPLPSSDEDSFEHEDIWSDPDI